MSCWTICCTWLKYLRIEQIVTWCVFALYSLKKSLVIYPLVVPSEQHMTTLKTIIQTCNSWWKKCPPPPIFVMAYCLWEEYSVVVNTAFLLFFKYNLRITLKMVTQKNAQKIRTKKHSQHFRTQKIWVPTIWLPALSPQTKRSPSEKFPKILVPITIKFRKKMSL